MHVGLNTTSVTFTALEQGSKIIPSGLYFALKILKITCDISLLCSKSSKIMHYECQYYISFEARDFNFVLYTVLISQKLVSL